MKSKKMVAFEELQAMSEQVKDLCRRRDNLLAEGKITTHSIKIPATLVESVEAIGGPKTSKWESTTLSDIETIIAANRISIENALAKITEQESLPIEECLAAKERQEREDCRYNQMKALEANETLANVIQELSLNGFEINTCMIRDIALEYSLDFTHTIMIYSDRRFAVKYYKSTNSIALETTCSNQTIDAKFIQDLQVLSRIVNIQ